MTRACTDSGSVAWQCLASQRLCARCRKLQAVCLDSRTGQIVAQHGLASCSMDRLAFATQIQPLSCHRACYDLRGEAALLARMFRMIVQILLDRQASLVLSGIRATNEALGFSGKHNCGFIGAGHDAWAGGGSPLRRGADATAAAGRRSGGPRDYVRHRSGRPRALAGGAHRLRAPCCCCCCLGVSAAHRPCFSWSLPELAHASCSAVPAFEASVSPPTTCASAKKSAYVINRPHKTNTDRLMVCHLHGSLGPDQVLHNLGWSAAFLVMQQRVLWAAGVRSLGDGPAGDGGGSGVRGRATTRASGGGAASGEQEQRS